MNIEDLMTDQAFAEDSTGHRAGPFKTKFGGDELMIFDKSLVVEEGDFIIQPLPGGREKKLRVVDVQFSSGLAGAIPPSFTLKVSAGSVVPAPTPGNTTYNISGTNVQVGNHNAQHITASFQTLLSDIEKSDFSTADKAEAKSRLMKVLESPVVLSLLGPAAQALIAYLGGGA